MKIRPSIDRLREVFELDSNTGTIFWKQKVARKIVVGSEAGYARADGYKLVQIDKIKLLSHHVVFAMTHNHWPAQEIDHANGNPSDNRPSNLREANRFTNNYNQRKPITNTSGIKGVFRQKRGKSWTVRLRTNGVLRRIGGFETKEDAAEFLSLWRSEAHGQFANDGAY